MLTSDKSKYEQIYDYLHKAITGGHYKNGERLPSEVSLAKKFKTSRPTVARSLSDLNRAGLIERIVGSGTYVKYDAQLNEAKTFGLMFPGMAETEIFEPISAYMSHIAENNNINLLWGRSVSNDAEARKKHARKLVDRYTQQNVDGVFFAPLELTDEKDIVNQRILEWLNDAGIPVVLLDRDIVPFPQRSDYDLVSIDNSQVGHTLTSFLIECGYNRIEYIGMPLSAPSVEMRISSYKQALKQAGIAPDPNWIHWGRPDDLDFVKSLVADGKEKAFICANDTTAAAFMHSLDELGVKIPEDVGVVGVDDIRNGTHLRVPLTTYHQPLEEIANLAVETMLSRISSPGVPIRSVYVKGELVIRKSTKQRSASD